MKKHRFIIYISIIIAVLAVFIGCGKPTPMPKPTDTDDLMISTPAGKVKKSDASPTPTKYTPRPYKPPKTDGFTKKEMKEIQRDGYMAYYYRRKYHPDEVAMVWEAVNTLMPDYSRREKLHATRSILAYHWVVYRTSFNHNMEKNVAVTKKYRHLIKKYADLHQVPVEMVEGVITWENSGGTAKESWAACVGVGQLSQGAVKVAHGFYKEHVKNLRKKQKTYERLHKVLKVKGLKKNAEKYRKLAYFYDVGYRHRALAKKLGVDDERLIPECNIEDAVIYLKLLHNNYGKRKDLAISAYHNGGLNNNDIIRSHFNRNHKKSFGPKVRQKALIKAIEKHDLKFIDLWEDEFSRDMLNGLRTVYGHIATSKNRRLALGDESDIYPWKIVAAYAALDAPDELLEYLLDKYYGEWDDVETRGMRTYDTLPKIRKAVKDQWLAPIPSKIYKDKGVGAFKYPGEDYEIKRRIYNYYTNPETVGFLIETVREYRKRCKNQRLKIPLKAVLNSKYLEVYTPALLPSKLKPHLRGAAVDIDLENAPHKGILYRILKEAFLHDRVFFINKRGERRITVNPRYGKYYLKIYRAYMASGKI